MVMLLEQHRPEPSMGSNHRPGRRQRSALALVIGAALRRHFSLALPDDGVISAYVDLHLILAGGVEAAKIKPVP